MSRPSIQNRFKSFVDQYGKLALGCYFAIFGLVYTFFVVTLSAGIGETDTAGTVGVAGAAWIATKVSQPLRIGATFLITPLVARLLKRGSAAAN